MSENEESSAGRMDTLEEELKVAKQSINHLKAVLYQILDQDDNDFFDDNIKLIERQNIRRMLKSKFPLTHETLDIVNKSRRPPQENIS